MHRGGERGSPVPGLDGGLPGPGRLPSQSLRTGPNQWLVTLGGLRELACPLPVTDPGAVAAEAAGPGCGFVARVELDACGAWVTMACTEDLRPLVVRRAGWVDERGDAVAVRARPWPEDRVGLGPGDAVVVVHRPSGAGDGEGRDVDPVAERLLDHLGAGAQGLLDASSGSEPLVLAVLAVPASVAGAGRSWVAEATGVPEDELELPGYPQGDREPERWRQPPRAPRRATFRLHRDLTRLRDLRGVLGRLVTSWRLQDRLDDGVLTLLTTELATNSLVHTDTPATATISYLGARVRVEVHDGSPQLPERRMSGEYDTGGRGIALIEEMAIDWGSTATPTGKRTWFHLAVGAPAVG